MAIFDCFTFFNELDVLEMRFKIMYPYVDHFVLIVSYQEGWMPLEWGKRFKTNTPILSFSSNVDDIPKIIVFGFCAATLNHRSN